ncbi:MAG TPA: hypothetical protein VNS09_24270 [Solirubrobacter sp.]|nr:hypothetical protein [Solirubrobacter sp.]
MRRLLLLTAIAAALTQAGPAHAASTCDISGKERKLGATYVTSVKATGVTCKSALSLVKAFHQCRRQHGVAGHCAKVRGYRCSERRDAIETQFDSRATCSSGKRKVAFTYTQNT